MPRKLQGRAVDSNSTIIVNNISFGSNVAVNTSVISLGNSTVNTLINSTSVTTTSLVGNGASITSVDAATLGGNTASTLRSYSDTVAATAFSNAASRADAAYSNAASYADTRAATAYSNATSYADTRAATAYSNATSYADTVAATAFTNAASRADAAYSNAIAYSGNAALAFSNAAARADAAYTNAVAYAASNSYVNSTFLPLAGGTLTGALTINATANIVSNLSANNVTFRGDVQIDGNLVVSGTSVTLNVASLAVEDNMIYLNSNSAISNPDLGIAGNYNDGTYRHAGFFRDATDGIWKVFDSYTPEPDASAYIDTTNNTFRIADFTANAIVGNTFTGNGASITSVNAATVGGNTASTLRTYSDTVAATAFSNAAARADSAYSNATSYASNGSNISSGTVAFARLPALYLGTTQIQSSSAAQAVSGITTLAAGNTTITGFANVSGNVVVGGPLTLSGRVIKYANTADFVPQAANTWYYLGRFQSTGAGDTVRITLAAGVGYNGLAGQHSEGVITIRAGNGAGTNISGTHYNIGRSTVINTVKMKSVNTITTDTHWDIYADIRSYAGHSIYKVETANTVTWTHSLTATTDPGAANSTLIVATSEFATAPNTALVVGGGATPQSNTVGQALGSTTARWNLTANTIDASGSATIGTTLSAGNTTITGFINVSTNTATFGSAAYVVANGNVGIGTSSPTANFEIGGSGNKTLRVRTDSNAYAYLNLNTWALDRAQLRAEAANPSAGSGAGAGKLTIWTANAGSLVERMAIDGDGNVGIGNTAPANKLTLSSATLDDGLWVGGNARPRIIVDSGNTVKTRLWHREAGWYAGGISTNISWPGQYNLDDTSRAGWSLFMDADQDFLDITRASAGTNPRTPASLMRITAAGNIGIGTTSPGNAKLRVEQPSGSYDNTYPIQVWAYANKQVININNDGSVNPVFNTDPESYWGPTATMIWKYRNTEQMRLASNGNVGIANTAPTYALHVTGSMRLNKEAGVHVMSKTIAATANSDIFTVSNQHGAQAFRVSIVNSSSGFSVAKTYEVVHQYGITPVYTKVVDTGAYSGLDFTVTFSDSGSTGVKCNIKNDASSTSANFVTTLWLSGSATTITLTEH